MTRVVPPLMALVFFFAVGVSAWRGAIAPHATDPRETSRGTYASVRGLFTLRLVASTGDDGNDAVRLFDIERDEPLPVARSENTEPIAWPIQRAMRMAHQVPAIFGQGGTPHAFCRNVRLVR